MFDTFKKNLTNLLLAQSVYPCLYNYISKLVATQYKSICIKSAALDSSLKNVDDLIQDVKAIGSYITLEEPARNVE
jgi:hypothetical protein